MKPPATNPLQLCADSWREIRNAIVRDNREIPFHQLSHSIRVRQPVIDAVMALPDEILGALHEHHRRGSLEKVLRKTLANLPPPPPNNQIASGVGTKPVIVSIGEGIGPQISSDEGFRRLLEAAQTIRLDERLGGLTDAAEVERQTSIPRKALQALRRRGLIVGFKDDSGKYVYPLEQFADGQPVDGLKEVLQIIKFPYTAWTWLLRPKPTIGGMPLELLKQGKLFDVLAAAERDFGPI